MIRYLILFMFCWPVVMEAQFILEIETEPDSAAVFMNGVSQGQTPLRVKFAWEDVPDSGLVFRIKHPRYKDEVYSVREKPRSIKLHKEFVMTKVYPHFKLDSASAMVEFDKLLAEFPSGKVVGQVKKGYVEPVELKWEGYSRLGSDPINLKTYDVLGSAGFNTPVKASAQLFSTEKRLRKTPRFVLGARVDQLWINLQSRNAYTLLEAEVSMMVEWNVFDRSTNQVVHRAFTRGYDKRIVSAETSEEILTNAYGDALYAFLGSGKLYEIIVAAGTASTVELPEDELPSTKEGISISKVNIQKFESNPGMVQYSTEGCVTIVTDAGHGSGVFITEDGYILTAEHVIQGVNRLDVVLSNGVELEGKVVSKNAQYDIALLKVNGNKFKALPLGKGMEAGLAVEVFTIGTPGDIELGQSVSKGILSGKRKHENIVYLQTDVAVSPGNSGGPLLDAKGQVIGIVQRKLMGEGIEGVGFALPIETALKQLGILVTE